MHQLRKIIIADDHPLFRAALHQALYQALGNVQFLEAADFDAAVALAENYPDAELMLLDLMMPGTSGLSGLAYLRGRHRELPVVIVSGQDDPELIYRALDLGAAGFIPKSTPLPQLLGALQTIVDGDTWAPPRLPPRRALAAADAPDLSRRLATLTPQQYRVLCLMSDGLLNKQIAADMQVTESTVKAHMTAVLRKLGFQSRIQAAAVMRSFATEE